LNSQQIEKKVTDLLNKIIKLEKSEDKKIIQQEKFKILSKLVADLFLNKNSIECFHNISNLIILILNIYNEKFPLDVYSEIDKGTPKNRNPRHKNILEKELLMK
jgi:hypothetical protein